MNQNKTIVESKIKSVVVLYNDDDAIVDYLADLKDRGPIRTLQRFVNYGNLKHICLLNYCKKDNLVVLLVYKDPFGFNSPENRLMVFVHPELIELCRYFGRWRENNIGCFNLDQQSALDDITRLLYNQWAESEDYYNDVETDFLG